MNYMANDSRYANPAMYRRCGKSGVQMSALSLGFWKNFGGDNDFANAKAMAEHAFDRGITCFDLANNYGPPYGSAEETLGRLMDVSFRPYRDELFIATKAGYDMWPGPYGDWGSRKHLMASLDQSLGRMHLDYVDLFYTHRYDPETPLEETLQALVDIVRQGKALYIGISRYPKDVMDFACSYLAERDVPCLCYQGRLNLLDRAVDEQGILSQMTGGGIGFVGFSPLAEGLLSSRCTGGIPSDARREHALRALGAKDPSEVFARIQAFDAVARERGESLATMSLAWILQHPGVTSVIMGASRIEQIDDNLKSVDAPAFTSGQLAALGRA